MKLSIAAALAAGAFLVTMQPASAVTTPCSSFVPNVTDFVSNSSECEASSLATSQPSPKEINDEKFFTFSDWTELGKVDAFNTGSFTSKTDGRLTIEGVDTTRSGTWGVSSFVSTNDYMLLFKDGAKAVPGSLVGYLLTASSGTFEQMFYKDDGTLKDGAISNIRLFERTGVIPVPAGVLLIGTAFVAAGAVSARARARRKVA